MTVHQLTITAGQYDLLRTLLGSRLLSCSGDEMQASNFAWFWLDVTTTAKSIRCSNKLVSLSFGNAPDEYTAFAVENSTGPSRLAQERGNIYFQGQGQTINEIWIIQDSVHAIKDDQPFFDFVTDRAIVFKLDNLWLVISKGSLWSEAIYIAHATSRDSVSLPAQDEEWPSDLLERFEFDREWIQL